MGMAIVTTQVMYAFGIDLVTILDRFVPFGMRLQLQITRRLSKGKVVLANHVETREIVDNPIRVCNAHMPDTGQKPGDQWQRRPHDTIRKSRSIGSYTSTQMSGCEWSNSSFEYYKRFYYIMVILPANLLQLEISAHRSCSFYVDVPSILLPKEYLLLPAEDPTMSEKWYSPQHN